MSVRPLVVSFVGPSGVGKTTLIEQLIPSLRLHGLRVGTVKHAPHGHDVTDKPGSDSARHRTAGAEAVLLAGANGAVLFLEPDAHDAQHPRHHVGLSDDQQQLALLDQLVDTHLAHLDVVIAEGFAPIRDALVVMDRAAVPPKHSSHPADVWFRISDEPGVDDLGFHQIDEIAHRIVGRVGAKRDAGPTEATSSGPSIQNTLLLAAAGSDQA